MIDNNRKHKISVGLLGAGHLGKIHLKCLLDLSEYFTISGFYDPNTEISSEIYNSYKINPFSDASDLIQNSDAVIIATPTSTHFELARKSIESGKHLFIEKPLTATVEEARNLHELIMKTNQKGQVGFVERFNPAFLALSEQNLNPHFIEAHRLAVYNPRGTDVSVVLDLMIHDIDILLKIVKAGVSSISANGVAIVSKTDDIANARIEFSNGAVANITASRISMKNMRKFRLFQSDSYISMDFLEKKTEIIRIHDQPLDNDGFFEIDTPKGKKFIEMSVPEIHSNNAIKKELELFALSILKNTTPTATIEDGLSALELAFEITAQIEKNKSKIFNAQ